MTAARTARAPVILPFVAVCLVWGSTWIVIRDQLAVVPPSWSVAYRFAIAGAAMLGWAAWRGERLRLDAQGFALAAVLGLMQFMLNFNLVYRAEQHITSGVVAVVYALLLVPNAVLARVFLGQRIGARFAAGSAIALAGVALLFVHEARLAEAGPREALTGIGIALAGVMCASVANVMQAAERMRHQPPAAILGWAMLAGAGADAIWALATAGPPVFEPRAGYVAGLLYLGVIGSAFTFSLYFGLIRAIGPGPAAYTGAVIPVIAMAISTLAEGYRWSALAAGGAVLVIAGLALALAARQR
ncbi:DMT family transporter [Sphingomonas canadensis]|uniref:DMT family transporter n=1 Tax=Sphingomonas canadensis TaxID=1219257 RepID=A0ABW3HE19_9SPHN|nr:EamA family transporter [Sphingomonas canadensis]MCW3837188.1 EamA family transporter [Sphingomonas canadensis]